MAMRLLSLEVHARMKLRRRSFHLLNCAAHFWSGPVKAEIHPEYAEISATCSCGNVVKTRSTLCKDIHLEVCSNCHPFYTGRQKIMDTGGRVERFRRRFGTRTPARPA